MKIIAPLSLGILLLATSTVNADRTLYRDVPTAELISESDSSGWRSSNYSREAAALIAQATRATGAGDLAEAKRLYEQVAEEYPFQGIPAFARFLQLTEGEAAARSYVEGLEVSGEDFVILSRAYKNVGDSAKAASLLESAETLFINPENVILAARAFASDGRHHRAAEVLIQGLEAAQTPQAREVLFFEFLSSQGRRAVREPEVFLKALNLGSDAIPSHSEAAGRLDTIVFSLLQESGYFERREKYVAAKDNSPLANWFRVRLLVREEVYPEAAALLDEVMAAEGEPARILVEARAELARSLGDLESSSKLYRELADRPNATPRQMIDAARAELALRNLDGAVEIFDRINTDDLSSELRRLYFLHRFQIASFRRELKTLRDLYSSYMPNAAEDDFSFFHDVIFSLLVETEDHIALEEQIRKEFAEGTAAHPILWRLAAASAAEARKSPNELEALYQCVLAMPGNLAVLRALCDRAVSIASEVGSAPAELLIIPEEEVARIKMIANYALTELIRSQAHDPTWAIAYINYHGAIGTEDVPAGLLEALGEEGRKSARAIGVLAYALATNGYPEAAMDLYDQAVAMAPEDMDIRMNRASGLTRVDRWDEALEIYRTTLENGFRGRNYHVHEMLGRLWAIERHLGREDECVEYFKNVVSQLEGDWRLEALHDIGTLLANNKRAEDAELFLRQMIEGTDKVPLRTRGWELLGTAFYSVQDYDRAAEIFEEALTNIPENTAEHIALAQALAEVLSEGGNIDAAIERFESVARLRPDSMDAQAGLFRAALLARQSGDKNRSDALLKDFLESESTDFTLRREAQKLLGDAS